MSTSNTTRSESAATDSPLGAPGGNEPYKTMRAKNWAQEDGGDVKPSGNDPHATKTMGNVAFGSTSSAPKEQAKPSQGA